MPGSDDVQSIVLPFGVGINCAQYEFWLRSPEIIADPVEGSRLATQISPPFSVEDSIRHPETRKIMRIRPWVVLRLERLVARQLIEREHYLTTPSRGMILAAAFASTTDQADVRKRSMKKASRDGRDDFAWRAPLGGIAGVGVLDSLYHGNPVAGRSEFATEALDGDAWLKWNRGEVVRQLRVAWASRFAVDRPYQNCGIGALIAKHVKTVARRFRAPAADFLEVITTMPRGHATSSTGGFLEHAGYTMSPNPMKSRPLRRLDRETGYYVFEPAVKRYYWADLRD